MELFKISGKLTQLVRGTTVLLTMLLSDLLFNYYFIK